MASRYFSSWSVPGQTQTAATAIVQLIPPYQGPPEGAPFMYSRSGGVNNWAKKDTCGITQVGTAIITSGSTAHTWVFLRPKNFTTVAVAIAKNITAITLADDPGIYSTNYKYPTPGNVPPGYVADNGIAANDYVAIQLDSGQWHFSMVASGTGTTPTLTTGTPNVTGSTAAVGNIVFWFGAAGDKDPITGMIDPVFLPPVSATTIFAAAGGESIVTALRPGDPIVAFNSNLTAASTLAALAGWYSKP